MSDATQPQFFRLIKGSSKGRIETALSALMLDPQAPLEVATARLSWSPLLGSRLREIARLAADTGKPAGRSLPYASLRLALQVQVPDAMMLASDLGRPWACEGAEAFMHVAEDTGGTCAVRASGALRDWASMELRPWAGRLGLDEALVDAIDDAADPKHAFTVEPGLYDLAQSGAEGQTFDRLRHPVLQEVSRRLEGVELFPGLGPVFRIVRSRSNGREVQFQTWPVTSRSGGSYSMVASLSLETIPYLGKPILVVRASRRRWLDEIPAPANLRRHRLMTGYLMGRAGPSIAVEFAADVRAGIIEEPCSPEFMHQAMAVRADLARPLSDMVRSRGQDVFVGVPYWPQRDGRHTIGAGATTRDQLDLLDALMGPLTPMGLRPLCFRETEETKKPPKRAAEFHKALEAEALVADFALSLGRNGLDDADLLDAARTLLNGAEPPGISRLSALAEHEKLKLVQVANRARLHRAFGDEQPILVLVARREDERDQMRAAINGLFGGTITIVARQLPRDVHGPRQELPDAEKKAEQRVAARIEAWRELAEDLSSSHGRCHALVQADEWYGKRHDDPVNKLAARQALATIGNANVQYLLPPAGGWRGLAKYFHRVQAAVYDLIFGHAALVTEVGSLLLGAFSAAETRPRAIIGISLVTQSRLQNGARGGQLCLATRIDAIDGRTTGRTAGSTRRCAGPSGCRFSTP